MDNSCVLNEATTDLAAFDLGVTASSLCWHFDLATFAHSRQSRQELSALSAKLRADIANFPRRLFDVPREVDDANPSVMKSDSALTALLEKIDSWPRELDCEWFHNTIAHAEDFASQNAEHTPGGNAYYEIVAEQVPEVRSGLKQGLIDLVLRTDRQRFLFKFGESIDGGKHDPDVARHVFEIVDNRDSNSTFVESWSDFVPSPRTVVKDEVDFQYCCFDSGKPPLRRGHELEDFSIWMARVVALANGIGIDCVQPELSAINSPPAAIAAINQLTDSVRSALIAKIGNHRKRPLLEGSVRILDCAAIDSCGDETGVSSQPVIDSGSECDVETQLDGPIGSDETSEVNISASNHSRANDVSQDDELRIGNWEFTPGYAKFKTGQPFKLTNQPRSLLLRFVKARAEFDGQPRRIPWKKLTDIWADDPCVSRQTLTTAIARLNRILKNMLGDSCPDRPIKSTGHGDDLCYWLDATLR